MKKKHLLLSGALIVSSLLTWQQPVLAQAEEPNLDSEIEFIDGPVTTPPKYYTGPTFDATASDSDTGYIFNETEQLWQATLDGVIQDIGPSPKQIVYEGKRYIHFYQFIYPLKDEPYVHAPLSSDQYGYVRFNTFNEGWSFFLEPELSNALKQHLNRNVITLPNNYKAFIHDGTLFPLREHRNLDSKPAFGSTGYIGGDNSSLRYIDNNSEQFNKVVFTHDQATFLADSYGYLREFRSDITADAPYVRQRNSAGFVIEEEPPFGYVLYQNMEIGTLGKSYMTETGKWFYVYSKNGYATAIVTEPNDQAPSVTAPTQDGFIYDPHNDRSAFRLFDGASQAPGLNGGPAVRDIGNYRYEFDTDGYILQQTPLLRNRWAEYEGKLVYFDHTGNIATNQWIGDIYATADGSRAVGLRTIDNNTYYFHPETGHKVAGWFTIEGNQFLFSTEGHMMTGWKQVNNTWFFLEESGAMAKGWKLINGTWFFLEENGAMAKGWKLINGTWFFLEENGAMAKGWKLINGTWFFLEENGAMAKGWKLINGTWFFLEESGAMAKGWKLINGTWFFLEESGAMAKGWKLINGTWFFLEESGAMAKGWKLINGTWYYLSESGAMLTGTHTINNVRYTFNNSGALIATGQ